MSLVCFPISTPVDEVRNTSHIPSLCLGVPSELSRSPLVLVPLSYEHDLTSILDRQTYLTSYQDMLGTSSSVFLKQCSAAAVKDTIRISKKMSAPI